MPSSGVMKSVLLLLVKLLVDGNIVNNKGYSSVVSQNKILQNAGYISDS